MYFEKQQFLQLKKDISELETLLKQADRQRVKDILSIELRRLVSEHVKLVESLKIENTVVISTPIIQTNKRYQVKLNNYGNFIAITRNDLIITLYSIIFQLGINLQTMLNFLLPSQVFIT